MTDDELILYLDRQSQLQHKRTREMLIEAGRPDLAEDLDRRMRDIRLGIAQAAAIWLSISKTQRIVLEKMAQGAYLARTVGSATQYDALGRSPIVLKICRITTARNLSARNLIHVNGTVTDPEAQFVITEHGKFVLRRAAPMIDRHFTAKQIEQLWAVAYDSPLLFSLLQAARHRPDASFEDWAFEAIAALAKQSIIVHQNAVDIISRAPVSLIVPKDALRHD